MPPKPIVIAGPCIAENDRQIDIAIDEAKKRKVDFLRTNLWKPCDTPAFDGLKEHGLNLLSKVAQAGLNPALEVLFPDHVTMALEATLPYLKEDGKLLVWIGARNQNHFIQRSIAREAAMDPRVYLMVKNQPWQDDKHWEGIILHVLDAGFPKERLLNCYRGEAPCHTDENPLGFSNIVNFESALLMRSKTDIPIIFDPSQTGGSAPNAFKMAEAAASYGFDGVTIEVHHDPEHALTDSEQQLTWPQFDQIMAQMFPGQK